MAKKQPPAEPPEQKPDDPPADISAPGQEIVAAVQSVFRDYLRELERGGANEVFGVREERRCNDILNKLRAQVR